MPMIIQALRGWDYWGNIRKYTYINSYIKYQFKFRLHSTFRHDLKIYASDEGRVQMTAAAFAKGKIYDLEFSLA